MIHVDTVKVTLPLKRKFVISQGSAEVKTNVLVVMNNRYSGEASGSVYYGPSLEIIQSELKRGIDFLSRQETIDETTLELLNTLPIAPIARSALIGMILNYVSGEQNKYPWEVLGIGAPIGIRSSITIGIDSPESVLAQIKESPFPIVKVKLGSDYDPEIILGLEQVKDKEIRIDANGAWSLEKAEEMIHHLARNGIVVIEQPTTAEHVKEWPYLKKQLENVYLIIDEGLATYQDYEAVSEFVDGINIKMEKTGGVVEASRIARRAREDKKKVMLGCMVESSIGIAQSLYMSSLADYHDLDGPQLIDEDIASGIHYLKETIEVDREIIGGPKLKREIIEKYIQD
jgi:L-alanine-DL-glutamate epimerase-like enolase superfamily enzyme